MYVHKDQQNKKSTKYTENYIEALLAYKIMFAKRFVQM